MKDAATEMWDSFVGQIIDGRYLIQKKIGEGGVGAVYLAEDSKMVKRQVVVKVLLENWLENADVRRKFEHEKEALSRLDHPGIVSILDAGVLPDDKPFIVMPFVEGRTLRQIMDEQENLSLNFCADVIESLSEALETAHAAGVLHRDIKPANVILTEQADQKLRVRIIDFGIARVMNSQISPMTEIERSIGTVLYVAPEQLSGSRDQTPAADVYSCGIMVYEMLTGKLPFNPGSIIEMWELQKEGVKQKPSAIRPELSAETDNIILKALEHNPQKRFQEALKFGRSLADNLRQTDNDNKNSKPETVLDFTSEKSLPPTKEFNPDKSTFVLTTEQNQDEAQSAANLLSNLDFKFEPPPKAKPKSGYFSRTSIWLGLAGIMLMILIVPLLISLFNKPIVEVQSVEPENNKIIAKSVPSQSLQFYLDVQKKRDSEPFRATGREIFETGDNFKLNINPETAGQIYLFNEGKDEKGENSFYLLFPSLEQQNGLPQIEAGQQIKTKENEFTGQPGKEIIWIIWTKELLNEPEVARKNSLSNRGKVRNPELAQNLQDFLQKHSGDQLEVTKDDAGRRTILKSSNNIIVYRMELEHR